MERYLFISHNALGDTLCITCALRAFKLAHPDSYVTFVTQSAGYTRVLDGNPDIDFLLYNDKMLFDGLKDFSEEWIHTLPLDFNAPQTLHVMDMKRFCTTHEVFQEHISRGFTHFLGLEPVRERPYIYLTPADRKMARSLVKEPYVVLSFHSNSNPDREDGKGRKKDWPMENWLELCQRLRATGINDIVAIGSEYDGRYGSPVWRNLYGLPIKAVAALLESAACVVTLESGIGHLAHAVDAAMVMLYSDLMPPGWAKPSEATNCRVLYGDPHEFSPDRVMSAVTEVLEHSGVLTLQNEPA
ncbi:ADP-heptose:LPS heptosyltransferase [Lewinella aquimaris]|uniref:ADP-heptose:LPS heptosyltransferase n=1 Tax=Neolewinella aquimaris TaxID=1835722 RepID=A0A840EDM9_9BACT|nr:glycosyltransferase family 9 protein [Neolewinella aquimaris]MBB4079909.1 ADP-heptose:LPS heptosyltransferase [Neolewinella aquimaris]